MAIVVNACDVLLQGATRLVPVTVGAGSTWSGTVSGNVTGTIAGTAAATVAAGAANGTAALSGLSDKISKSATTITGSGFQQQSSGYASGTGYAYHDAGAIYKYGGQTILTIDLANAIFAFKGDITGATGRFYGSLRASTVRLYDDNDIYSGELRLYASSGGVALKSYRIVSDYSHVSLESAWGPYAELEARNTNQASWAVSDGVRGVVMSFDASGAGINTYSGYLSIGDALHATKLFGSASAPTYRPGLGAEVNLSLEGHHHTLAAIDASDTGYKFQFSTDGGATWSNIHLRRKDW